MDDAAPPQSFGSALLALTRLLEAEKVPYTFIGGLAVSLLAQPRATQDVDVVIWLDADKWASLVSAGEAAGFEPRVSDVLEFAGLSRVLLLRHKASGISIDVSCGALPFELEMIERARAISVGELNLKVPTAEDLIITKLVAHRPKDLHDVESLLDAHDGLDAARVRYWAREFAAVLEMPELTESLEQVFRRRGL